MLGMRAKSTGKALGKLVVDVPATASLGRGMDGELADLVIRLCTQAGMAMEDTSVLALKIGSLPVEQVQNTIDQLENATRYMLSIVIAARSLSRWRFRALNFDH